VHQHVEAVDRRDGGGQRGVVGDVDLPRAGVGEGGGQGLEGFGVTPAQEEFVGVRQRPGDGRADAARGAGDQSDRRHP
jgi:hypothetical protein